MELEEVGPLDPLHRIGDGEEHLFLRLVVGVAHPVLDRRGCESGEDQLFDGLAFRDSPGARAEDPIAVLHGGGRVEHRGPLCLLDGLFVHLAAEQREQALLGAEQTGYAAQFAMQLPGQRLRYAGQQADVYNALAAQAQQNRLTLLGVGQNVLNSERQFRLSTGQQWSTGNQSQVSGGGLKGALTGALGGAGAGMGIASGIGALGGGSSFGAAPSNQFMMPQMGSSFAASQPTRNFSLGAPQFTPTQFGGAGYGGGF